MTNKYVLAVVAVTLSLYVAISMAADPPTCQFYGETCQNGSKPNNTHWLECSPTNLRCKCQSGLYWDPTKSVCLAKVGSACYTLAEDGSPLKECTDGAKCLRDPKVNVTDTDDGFRCFCTEANTVANEYGRCQPTHQGTCNNDAECLITASLTCDLSQHKCVCDWDGDGKQKWDGAKCASVVGGKCSETAGHYVNRTCFDPNAECDPQSQVCKCKDKFHELGEICVVGYGGSCVSQSDCAPSFSCRINGTVTTTTAATTTTTVKANATLNDRSLNSRKKQTGSNWNTNAIRAGEICMCDPNSSEYDESEKICRIFASKTCDLNNNSTSQCVNNAVCSQGSCTCKDGFMASGGHCLGQMGSSCSGTNGCLDSEFLVCNTNTSACQCKDNYSYNNGTNKCVAPLGSQCNDNSNCNGEGAAVCIGDNASRTCKCKDNYTQQGSSNVCRGTHEQNCDATLIPCNSDQFLRCNMAKCSCYDDHFWDKDVKVCKGWVDSRCGGEYGPCVANATCSPVSATNSTSFCKCAETFVVNANRTCDSDSGANSIRISGVASLLFAMLVAAKNFM